MRNGLAVIGLVVIGMVLGTQIPSSKAMEQRSEHDAAKQYAQEAMDRLKADDIPGMFAVLKKKLIWPASEFSPTEDTCKKHREALSARYGKALGEVELVGKEVIGHSFVRFVYLEKLERHVFVWRLTYYRASEEWRFSELEWSDKHQPLFQTVP